MWHRKLIIALCPSLLVVSPARAAETPAAQSFSCAVEFSNAVLPANQPQRAIAKISLDVAPPLTPDQRPWLNVCLVLDRSGSMQGVKLEKAKQAALNLVNHMSETDRFSLVTCNNQVKTIISARSAGDTRAIAEAIKLIQASGGTSLFGGISQGASEIRRHLDKNYVNRIILISDGVANQGPRSARELGRLGASLQKENISITTIGIGDRFNEDLLTQLSELSDGNTYYVQTATELPAILDQEMNSLLSISAHRIRVTAECLDGTRPVRVIGRQGRVIGNQVEFALNQLYGGQPKFALLEVAVPPGTIDQRREVIQVRCQYEVPATQQILQATTEASIVYSDSPQDILKGNNKIVQRDYNYNTLAVAQEAAITLIDQGQQDQAVRLLNDNVETINAWAVANEDAQLLKETEAVQKQLEQVHDAGLTRRQRKQWKSGSVQTRTQQLSPPKQ